MKVRMYKLIQEIVDSGIESGYQYACKHTENPHPDTIKHCIERYIMQGFDEAFEFDMEECRKNAAKRCKQIAQQRYLSENPAFEIEEKISAEFGV